MIEKVYKEEGKLHADFIFKDQEYEKVDIGNLENLNLYCGPEKDAESLFTKEFLEIIKNYGDYSGVDQKIYSSYPDGICGICRDFDYYRTVCSCERFRGLQYKDPKFEMFRIGAEFCTKEFIDKIGIENILKANIIDNKIYDILSLEQCEKFIRKHSGKIPARLIELFDEKFYFQYFNDLKDEYLCDDFCLSFKGTSLNMEIITSKMTSLDNIVKLSKYVEVNKENLRKLIVEAKFDNPYDVDNKYFSPNFINEEMAEIIYENPSFVLACKYLNQELFEMIMKNSPNVLFKLLDSDPNVMSDYLNKDNIEYFIENMKTMSWLQYIPKNIWNQNLVNKVIKECPEIIFKIPEEFLTDEAINKFLESGFLFSMSSKERKNKKLLDLIFGKINNKDQARVLLQEDGYDGIRGDFIKILLNNEKLKISRMNSPIKCNSFYGGLHYYFDPSTSFEESFKFQENYGSTEVSKEEIIDAAKLVKAETIIQLNNIIGKELEWYDTWSNMDISSDGTWSCYAWDPEERCVYQKCQMAYPT